jgi:mannan endo-1,4-beta-mannosidase
LIERERSGRHRQFPPNRVHGVARRRRAALITTISVVAMALLVTITFVADKPVRPAKGKPSTPANRHNISAVPGPYIGLYSHGVPGSYTGIKAFAAATGINPAVVSYYSGWLEPFEVEFAKAAVKNGAIPLVQIDPEHVSIAAVAAGRYDSYLSIYAKAVRSYHHPVILSFGHEMNGYWYSWGYTHTAPSTFVAAWRHIVTLFRTLKVGNVTWLWTINTIHEQTRVPSPGPWWPGDSFVNWVGIDGYFTRSSSMFASVFGPTIIYVRTLTHRPIFIAETSATPAANQPAKIAELFNGIRLYGLLGFAWFNSNSKTDWRLRSPAAIAVFRRYADKLLKSRPLASSPIAGRSQAGPRCEAAMQRKSSWEEAYESSLARLPRFVRFWRVSTLTSPIMNTEIFLPGRGACL